MTMITMTMMTMTMMTMMITMTMMTVMTIKTLKINESYNETHLSAAESTSFKMPQEHIHGQRKESTRKFKKSIKS